MEEVKFLGAIDDKYWIPDGKDLSRNFPQGNRVYSIEGVAVTLSSQGGGIGGTSGLYLVSVNATEHD